MLVYRAVGFREPLAVAEPSALADELQAAVSAAVTAFEEQCVVYQRQRQELKEQARAVGWSAGFWMRDPVAAGTVVSFCPSVPSLCAASPLARDHRLLAMGHRQAGSQYGNRLQ
jgi:hypothetical protein